MQQRTLPPIEHFTTTVMIVVEPTRTLAEAARLMREHSIRHLPIVEDGEPIGVISERDVHLVETLPDVDPARITVAEAMRDELYLVDPEAPLDQVARHMAEHRYGCAIVARGSRIVGLFTTTDALRALSVLMTRDLD